MTKLLALALLGVGMTSGALALAGYNLAALSWIENAGETNAWGMREMMVLIGGGMLFLENFMGDEGLEGEVKK